MPREPEHRGARPAENRGRGASQRPTGRTGERILVVEDDCALREVMTMHLERADYLVDAVGDGDMALERCAVVCPDVVILDLMLPSRSGLEVCRALRARYQPSPGVVMVTARGSEADMVIGLDAGADDYVVKPFAPPILLARLAALCRRLEPLCRLEPEIAQWGEIVVDLTARRAEARGQLLSLTPTELTLLAYLCRHAGQVVSRKCLLTEVFGTSHDGYTRNVDCHVTRLRRKLEASGWSPAPIYAVYGAGYRLGEP